MPDPRFTSTLERDASTHSAPGTATARSRALASGLVLGLALALSFGSCRCDPQELGIGARVLPMSRDQAPSVDELLQVVYKYYPRWHPGKEPLDNYLVGYHHTPEIVALRTQVARVLGNDDKWQSLLADVREEFPQHQVVEGAAPTYHTPSFQLIITLAPPAARSPDQAGSDDDPTGAADDDDDETAIDSAQDPAGESDDEAPGREADDGQDSRESPKAPSRQLIFRLSHLAPVYDYHETEHATQQQAAIAMHFAPTTEAGPVVAVVEDKISRHFGYHRMAHDDGKTPIIEVGVGALRPGEATLADALFDASRRF